MMERNKLLKGKDKASTQHATKSYIDQFRGYLRLNDQLEPEHIPIEDLSEILYTIYDMV